MITADQIVAHLVGDYILQSHWMATEKTKRTLAAVIHALCYTLPFLLLTTNPAALIFIAASHAVIDRWRLARYVVWLKNWLCIPSRRPNGIDYTDGTINVTFESRPTDGDMTLGKQPWDWPNRPWSECSATGYPDDVPAWLSVWLLIITDNTLHILCNAAAFRWAS